VEDGAADEKTGHDNRRAAPSNAIGKTDPEKGMVFIARYVVCAPEEAADCALAEIAAAKVAIRKLNYFFEMQLAALCCITCFLIKTDLGEDADGKTHPVARKDANKWNIHDMHGNVWEWCQDWYGEYDLEKTINPAGPADGSGRVFRGGGWGGTARYCRSALRQFEPGVRVRVPPRHGRNKNQIRKCKATKNCRY
jgi:hypothetical protein